MQKREKRRWLFRKPPSNIIVENAPKITLSDAANEQRHAIAVAVATAAAAEAAVASAHAAMEVARLTRPPSTATPTSATTTTTYANAMDFSYHYHYAATLIQTAFRGYLASDSDPLFYALDGLKLLVLLDLLHT